MPATAPRRRVRRAIPVVLLVAAVLLGAALVQERRDGAPLGEGREADDAEPADDEPDDGTVADPAHETGDHAADEVDAGSGGPEDATLRPPDDGAYHGAYARDLLEEGGIERYRDRTGGRLAIAHWYQGWGEERAALNVEWLERARDADAVPMITWEPWARPDGAYHDPEQPAYRLARIADGAHDDYVEEWMAAAAEYGGPLLVRFAHEMNGTWYPWSVTENGNRPADYVAAWRHVHDLAAEAGADNLTWVWAVNIVTGLPDEQRALDLAELHPGDDYVDWTSMVGFNHGTIREWSRWRPPEEIFAETAERLARFDQPVMISETGTVTEGGDAGEWVADLLATAERDHPDVRAVVWFDARRDDDIDFRLRDEALEGFRRAASAHWDADPAFERHDGGR